MQREQTRIAEVVVVTLSLPDMFMSVSQLYILFYLSLLSPHDLWVDGRAIIIEQTLFLNSASSLLVS
jgi:hypothetical protein